MKQLNCGLKMQLTNLQYLRLMSEQLQQYTKKCNTSKGSKNSFCRDKKATCCSIDLSVVKMLLSPRVSKLVEL